MKKKQILIALILTIILTLLSVAIQKSLVNADKTIIAYKLNKDKERGEEITEEDLSECTVIEKNEDYIYEKSEAVNKVAKYNMYKDELINKQRLISTFDNDYFDIVNKREFGIEATYFDDTYSLTLPKGTKVDIVFTKEEEDGTFTSEVVLENATIIGKIDSEGNFIDNGIAQTIKFESATDGIIDISSKQFSGKFKLIKVPLSENKEKGE